MNSGFVYSSFKSSSVDFSPFVKRVVYAVLLCKQQASLLHGYACYHSYQVFFFTVCRCATDRFHITVCISLGLAAYHHHC